jgi:plasmid stability protein
MAIIQVRNVSDETHRRLKARAALAGMSLSDYVRQELDDLAALPTLPEMLERLEEREPVGGMTAAEALAEERAERGAG